MAEHAIPDEQVAFWHAVATMLLSKCEGCPAYADNLSLEHCRLPCLPLTPARQKRIGGSLPLCLKSLGFESWLQGDEFEGPCGISAAALQLYNGRETLGELHLRVSPFDDTPSIAACLRNLRVQKLMISGAFDAEPILTALPESVESLRIQQEVSQNCDCLLGSAPVAVTIREFDAPFRSVDVFRHWAHNPPPRLEILGRAVFRHSQLEKLQVLQNTALSAQLVDLAMDFQPIDHLAAICLGDSDFPALRRFSMSLGQPGDGLQSATVTDMHHIASTTWWNELKSLRVQRASCDELIGSLVTKLPETLESLLLTNQPHSTSIGVTDAAFDDVNYARATHLTACL